MNIALVITDRFMRWKEYMARILSSHDNYYTVAEVYKKCAECQLLFFDNEEAFVVANVIEYPRERRLHILLAGGTIAGLDKLDPIITKFGIEIGATKATFIGRRGFLKVLKRRGWTTPYIYMEKELV